MIYYKLIMNQLTPTTHENNENFNDGYTSKTSFLPYSHKIHLSELSDGNGKY